jgi:hypothetical protein
VHVAVDTSVNNLPVLADFGRAWGQSFYASDTSVKAVTVWRPALPETSLGRMQLFVTRVDESGQPVPWEILLTGPVRMSPNSDGIHPVRVDFTLDPPFALPGPGEYFFAVKDYSCHEGFMLLVDTLDCYSQGSAWRTIGNVDCSGLGASPVRYNAAWDLVFDIEFCATATRIGRRSWGQLKRRYR